MTFTPVFMERAEAMGYHCDYRPEISKQEAFELLPDYEGIVIRSKISDRQPGDRPRQKATFYLPGRRWDG